MFYQQGRLTPPPIVAEEAQRRGLKMTGENIRDAKTLLTFWKTECGRMLAYSFRTSRFVLREAPRTLEATQDDLQSTGRKLKK